MSIDISTVKKISNLSKLNFVDNQEENIKNELNNILNWVDDLKKVNTQEVEPMLSVFNEKINMRSDDVEITNQNEILSNAPEQKEGFFVVTQHTSIRTLHKGREPGTICSSVGLGSTKWPSLLEARLSGDQSTIWVLTNAIVPPVGK